ncbi:uncharacterized protein [Littorina saxatilis]|uniref:uncharacterized protein n=1 Tax=Littorina saxatilis TaxID=31220 RepID=UPI0038B4B817
MASLRSLLVFLLVYLVCVPFADGCGGTYTLLTGTITSPNFPNNYTNNLNCSYVFTAPVGYRVTINFIYFDLEITPLCQFDNVEIRDGDSESDGLIGRLCNISVPHARRSFGNRVLLKFVTDATVTRSGFRATFSAANDDDSFFLIGSTRASEPGLIQRMDTKTITNYAVNMASLLYNPVAVDYNPVDEKIYWTEVTTTFNAIRSADLDGSGVHTIYNAGLNATLDGLAVDPLSRLIFYSDAAQNVIAMLTMSTWAKKTVVTSNLDNPRAIVLDTANGVLFWTDWGAVAKIERANYDGSERRTLVNFNLRFTNALALDVANNRLYWADAATNLIESAHLDGSGRKEVMRAISSLHFFGLALFNNALYITDWGHMGHLTTESRLIRLPLDGGNVTIVGSVRRRLNDIHVYHQDSLMTGPNGCGDNNGGCSVICIPLHSNSSKCMCPDGQQLSSDQKNCVNDGGSITSTTTSTTTSITTNIAVFVTASERLPFQTDGSQELTLTCRPDTTVQVTQYRWSVTCARQTGNTCVYLPKSEDDRNVVACTVTLADGRSAVGRLQIMLEYPPQTPPVINGYKKGDVLQAGDDLRLTCSVLGGKPLVKNVILSCDGHPDTAPDIAGQTEVHSVLEFKSVRVEDNGKRCICTAEWKDTDWYRLSVTTTLIVNGTDMEQHEEQKGPSVPIIAGGAAGGVVVIIIVVVVVVFVVKRNRHPTYDRPNKRRKSSQAPISPYTGLGHVGDAPFAISNGSYDAQTAGRSGLRNTDDDVNRESLYAKIEEVPEELPPPIPCRPSLPTISSTESTDSYLHPVNSPDHGYAGHVASDI